MYAMVGLYQAKLENQLEALRRRLEEESNARLRAEEQLKERAAAMAQQPQAQATSPGQLQQQLTPGTSVGAIRTTSK